MSSKSIAVWEYLGRNTSGLSLNSAKRNTKILVLLGSKSPMGLGRYNSLGEYCGLSTASDVFLY